LPALLACGRFAFSPSDARERDDDDSGTGDSNDATVQPSCIGLPATCGSGGNASCCDSPHVPGGTFYRSYDGVGYNDIGFPATVRSFRLDAYEVTVGRFRAFVAAGAAPPSPGAGAHPALTGSGWNPSWDALLPANQAALLADLNCDGTIHSWTNTPAGNENLPIACVSWYLAMAFCVWDGGYLPTEAEWNHAAAGGEQRAFPWSTPPGSTTIVQSNASFDCLADGVADCAVTDYVQVGTRNGHGAWGHADLGGNVWEWVLDYNGQYPLPCVDCANLLVQSDRVLRGGSLYNSPATLRQGLRSNDVPTVVRGNNGVRCARAP
jgi:formylglycine-generating enzyme required for sulfatase activity